MTGGLAWLVGSACLQMLDADSGPSFQLVDVGDEFFESAEVKILESFFVGFDVVGVEVEEVDEAEMDLADFIRVVVDEANHLLGMAAVDDEFLFELAFDGVEVGGGAEGVFALVVGVDMTADADALFGVKAFLTRFAATGVNEVAALVMENVVGDDLFVGRIEFGGRARKEEVGTGGQHGVEVAGDVGLKSFERPEFVEQGAGDDENVFDFDFGDGGHARGW